MSKKADAEQRRERMSRLTAALRDLSRTLGEFGSVSRQAARQMRRAAWRMEKEQSQRPPWETDADAWKDGDSEEDRWSEP